MAAAFSLPLPHAQFTLAWNHSIEKIRWEEDYRVAGDRLRLVEARIRGSGAGMEPPEGAVLKDGAWHYVPPLPPLERLRLTRSPYVPDYTLCWDNTCRPLTALVGPVENAPLLEVAPCEIPQE
ncbi:DUF1850 domain-containing protein [Noviherbaspirillum massiliense]|uniref:DUF1850 domain-containing protein n=1 Tax=Noviherbaspirillum massiliense TaxID=1465823 RepID=UPI00031CC5F3|nr:DUF1850 domain-containing protein [Noviherbaspirillum massiliense]